MFSSNRNRATVLVLFVVIAFLALLLYQTGQLAPAQDLALGWIQPLLRGALGITQSAENVTGTLADVATLQAEVKRLQGLVNASEIQRVRVRELENENTQLRQQLRYKQSNPDFDLLGAAVLEREIDLARVIGRDPSNLARFIIIDQGSAEGVKVGMPVVTPEGLVGRVTATGAHWAKALLITDPSSSVNAVVQSTRATGITQGDVNGNVIIKYVPQGEAIKPGDLILTSGMGGNFPKRLVIGQVTEVHKRDIELFQEAAIKPTVDFTRLEFVLILKKFTPSDITQEPTPTPTAAPRPTRTVTPTPSP
ncbi:MAG: rod shape-determining protein MreC [Chloroflexi bacterium]|nr:rod shape-determining protein MreC [Chloroflexota bacterium]